MEELAFQRDEAGFTEWDETDYEKLQDMCFYNTSEWTLQRLHNTGNE